MYMHCTYTPFRDIYTTMTRTSQQLRTIAHIAAQRVQVLRSVNTRTTCISLTVLLAQE